MSFSTLAYIAIVGGVWAFLWWYFARYVIGRRRINSGNRAIGLVAFEAIQNADGGRAVQEILHTEEASEEKHHTGDPEKPRLLRACRAAPRSERGAWRPSGSQRRARLLQPASVAVGCSVRSSSSRRWRAARLPIPRTAAHAARRSSRGLEVPRSQA